MNVTGSATARDFGVALSGGGVRASAFALGALLYLVDSGLNRRVSVISSVSGASLTNGFLLTRADDFAELDPSAFDAIARDFIRRLTTRPVMGLATSGVYVVLLVGLAVSCGIAIWGAPGDPPLWFRLALPVVWGAVMLRRARPIEWAIERRYLKPHKVKMLGPFLGRARDAQATSHVFCATDLVTESPFFLVDHAGKGWAYSRYGWFEASRVPLAAAVRASAALPGGFPPRALRTSLLNPASGRIPDASWPPWLHLADGGVWDNLGTQWFEDEAAPEEEWAEVVEKIKDAPAAPPHGAHDVRRLLVVDGRGWGTGFGYRNATFRSLILKSPLIAEAMSLLAASSIQYENTVDPRTRAFNRTLRLQITSGHRGDVLAGVATLTKHPLQPAAREVEAAIEELGKELPNHGVLSRLARAMQAVAVDLKATEPAWLVAAGSSAQRLGELHKRCAAIGTTLAKLSTADAMALVIHGYVEAMGAASTMVALESGPTADLPMKFPGLDRFQRLLASS